MTNAFPLSRRALARLGLAALARPAFPAVENEISHTAESIHQEPVFREPQTYLRCAHRHAAVREDRGTERRDGGDTARNEGC